MSESITVPKEEMYNTFLRILSKNGFTKDEASVNAEVFTTNSVEGIYTHGVNRFARFIEYVQKGLTVPGASPVKTNGFAGIEQWDGQLGPGPGNAIISTDRSIELAKLYGIGCVALANTSHWMRGGYYGWRAAKEGFALIAWTNTIGNMPAWNALDRKLGNNPLVFAIPFQEEAIVMDLAMSQFSYGATELAAMKNEQLPVNGGFDKNGELTKDPNEILQSKRFLPTGYWKGAGLSLLLDILATVLSAGIATFEVTRQKSESGVSQVFIAINLEKISKQSAIQQTIKNIIDDYLQSVPISADKKILYPGERVIQTRKRNLENGIPVMRKVWDEILLL